MKKWKVWMEYKVQGSWISNQTTMKKRPGSDGFIVELYGIFLKDYHYFF